MSESLDGAVHLAPVFLVFYSVALVIFLLAFCECDVHLRKAILVDVDAYGDDGETRLVFRVSLQIPYLFLVQEQFAVALLLVVVV